MCKLIVITNRKLCTVPFLEQIEMLAEAGVDRIVLREKDMMDSQYIELAKKVSEICEKYGTEFMLHNFTKAAEVCKCNGIHLPMPVLEKWSERKVFSETAKCIVGASVHSEEQLSEALRYGTDYVFYSHVFLTDCKKGLPAKGIENLRKICEKSPVPVYALGGITPENALETVKVGAAGVCIMSYAMKASSKEIKKFVDIF